MIELMLADGRPARMEAIAANITANGIVVSTDAHRQMATFPIPDAELDYSDVPYDDCPPEEKKRRREAALAKRGIGGKP